MIGFPTVPRFHELTKYWRLSVTVPEALMNMQPRCNALFIYQLEFELFVLPTKNLNNVSKDFNCFVGCLNGVFLGGGVWVFSLVPLS